MRLTRFAAAALVAGALLAGSATAERATTAEPWPRSPLEAQLVLRPSLPFLYVHYDALRKEHDGPSLRRMIDEAVAKIDALTAERGMLLVSGLYIVNRVETDERWTFDVGRIVEEIPAGFDPGTTGIQTGQSPSGYVVTQLLRGSYAEMPHRYAALKSFAQTIGRKPGGLSWEEYLTDPALTQPDALRTNLFLAVE